MKKSKLFKKLLIPSLGVLTLGTIAAVATSCDGDKPTPVIHVESVTLNESSVVLDIGETKALIETVLPENATDKSVTWTSSNPEVATVENGKVTAVLVGTANITVTTRDGGKTDTCQVTVVKRVTEVDLNQHELTIPCLVTSKLTATVSPDDATNKDLNWKSDNEEVATVDADGVVRGKAIGTATITVSSVDNPEAYDQCTVNVTALIIHVESVSLDMHNLSLAVGDNHYLNPTISPADATDKSVTWTSSDTNVATVDANGTITAVGVGNATITVITNDGHYTDTCAVTVVKRVTDVYLDQRKLTIPVHETSKLTATVWPDDATNKDLNWKSDNERVATVDADGVVRAKAMGTATITVSSVDNPEAYDECKVYVTEPVIHVESVSLDKHDLTLTLGDNHYLNPTVSPWNATDPSVTWASDNETVATVDENGQVTAVGKGTATITVTTNDGHYTDTCEVTVTSLPYVVVSANEDSILKWIIDGNNLNLQYSIDGGANWTEASKEYYSWTLNISRGTTLWLKGNNPNGWSHVGKISEFVITGNVSISGNIMGLLDNGAKPGEQGDITTIPETMCFSSLFSGSTAVRSVSEDFLPATGLARNCYSNMFNGCSNLTTAPDLPATTLVNDCYSYMFYHCSSLTSIRIGYIGNYTANYFDEWVNGVASSGIFYYKGTDSLANFGFPSGWTKNPNY